MPQNVLKESGLRATNRREAILHVLEQANAPITADEIHALAVTREKMGLSTAYRVLAQLTEHGLFVKNDGGNGRFYYQINCPQHHMHTLHCSVCDEVVPIDGCPLATLEEEIAAQTGYQITGHSLAFTGICPKCQK